MKNSGETCIDVRHLSFPDDQIDPQKDQADVPLIVRPPSKSSILDELRDFKINLKWCALDHSSSTGKLISYSTFVVLAIVVPLASCFTFEVQPTAPAEDPTSFNKLVNLPESGLATIGFFTLTRFFKLYSLRQLLFLDVLQEDSLYVQLGYTRELDKVFRYLAYILLPSFLVEILHKIIFFSMVKVSFPYLSDHGSILLNSVVFLLVLASWVYRTSVFMLVCVLFRSTCELQLLRFEGFKKLLEGSCGSDSGYVFQEHVRIRKQLSVTSHRYRFFIIGCGVTLTVSQFGALLLVLASKSEKSFFNSGDLVVCSVIQLSGFLLCIMGAARITHRAQGIVSVATKWHMFLTSSACNASDCHLKDKAAAAATNGTLASKSGHDDHFADPANSLIAVSSQVVDPSSSFQTRHALVTYLQHNNGGITLFGYALDRGLLHTLFAFEFSLVLWILSKAWVIPAILLGLQQLKNSASTITCCWDDIMNPNNKSKNYLTFGTTNISRSPTMMQYTDLGLHQEHVYYYVNLTGISVGGIMLQILGSFDTGIVVDSGTMSTYLLPPAFEPLMAALKPTFMKFERVLKRYFGFEFCFNTTTTGFDESLVPKLVFDFGVNKVQFAPPVRNYVVEVDLGVRCLGFSRAAGSQ